MRLNAIVRLPALRVVGITATIAAFSSLLTAVEFSVGQVSLPFFNPAGKLTHKLFAQSGTKTGNLQQLREVEIHYFSPTDPTAVVQKVVASEATWDARAETLVGRGTIAVSTEDNRLNGEGFDFALATSLLHIHRNFMMSNLEMVVTSDRATVELIVERTGEQVKVRDVRRCEAIGNLKIVVQPTATQTYEFDQAYSDRAIYSGVDSTVRLPNRIRIISNGAEGSLSHANIRLKKSPEPSSPP